ESYSVARVSSGAARPGRTLVDAPADALPLQQFAPRRLVRLGLLSAAAAGFVSYVVMRVPVVHIALHPVVTRNQVVTHWPIAAAALAAVVAGDALAVWLGVRAHRVTTAAAEPDPGMRSDALASPAASPLRVQFLPWWALLTTALVTAGVVAGTFALGLPLWAKVLAILVVWSPLFV